MKKDKLHKIYLLIDWDNATRTFGLNASGIAAVRFAEKVILLIQQEFSHSISKMHPDRFHDVRMRFYDGWSSATEDTQRGKIFREFLKDKTRYNIGRKIGRVSFLSDYDLGDHMFGCVDAGRLYGTHRAQGQKMVDTALVCDALTLTNQKVADLVVIVSDDDDFIPAAVCSHSCGGKTLLFRSDTERIKSVLRGSISTELVIARSSSGCP